MSKRIVQSNSLLLTGNSGSKGRLRNELSACSYIYLTDRFRAMHPMAEGGRVRSLMNFSPASVSNLLLH